jgi:hypothetical protein
MPKAEASSKPGQIRAARIAAEAGMTAHRSHRAATLIKKKVKFSSYIRKFRVEQLESHSYMTNGLLIWGNICAFPHICIRKPFLIYAFATAPL